MKIFAFAASNSKASINRRLVQYALGVLKDKITPDAAIDTIDLIDYELPFYRPDREEIDGVPQQAEDFLVKIAAADALIISFAEHNGSYTAVYKNLFDWASRAEGKVFQNKPAVLMATSPGKGGAKSVLKQAIESAPFFDMVVRASVSVPDFYDNFNLDENRISNGEIENEIIAALKTLI